MKRIVIYICTALFLGSCSTTRRIPQGEQLYTGIKKIDFETTPDGEKIPAGLQSQIEEAVEVAPNNYISRLCPRSRQW